MDSPLSPLSPRSSSLCVRLAAAGDTGPLVELINAAYVVESGDTGVAFKNTTRFASAADLAEFSASVLAGRVLVCGEPGGPALACAVFDESLPGCLCVGPVAVRADCGDDAAVRGAVAAVAGALGGLDIVVCSAGTTRFVPLPNLDAITDEDWESIMRLNTRGPFYAARAAAPLMRARGGGLVVFVGSVAGLTGGGSSIVYAASKGALATLTKSLAKALAPAIRVNAVAPGIVNTRWVAGKDEFIARYGADTPLGRVAEADDVAGVILSFATTSLFLTGEITVVDGGREMR